MPEEAAGSEKRIRRPRNWDKCVNVAYLRMLGASQEMAAKKAGCSERSIRNWEKAKWWKDAEEEARDRWLKDGDMASMRGVLSAMARGDAATARWWADRRVPELAPPSKRIAGPDGGPLRVELGSVDPRLRDMTDEQLIELEGEMEAAIEKVGSHGSDST